MEAGLVETRRIQDKFQQDVVDDRDIGSNHVLVFVFEFDARQHKQDVVLADLAHRENHGILRVGTFGKIQGHQVFERQERDEILVG